MSSPFPLFFFLSNEYSISLHIIDKKIWVSTQTPDYNIDFFFFSLSEDDPKIHYSLGAAQTSLDILYGHRTPKMNLI